MQDELLNVGAAERVKRLGTVAKSALDLSEWAAEGRSDYFLAAQINMLVRSFAETLPESPTFPALPEIIAYLGSQIQTSVGRTQRPEGRPAVNAVEPVHETVLQATGGAEI